MLKKVLSLVVVSYFFCPFQSAKGQVTSIGSEHRFDVATWNIEWFGSPTNGPSNDDFQWQQVFEIIRDSNIDVWALQEIADEARFFSLLNALGSNWHGELASLSGTQKLAFVYNTDVLRDVSVEHILTESNATYSFASRPPLALHGMVSLTDTTFAATLINVHMKAFMDQTSWERRVQASGLVKDFIDTNYAADANVLLLGDLNDGVTGSYFSNYPSPYVNFAWDSSRYAVLTKELEETGEHSYIGSTQGSNIDHMISTDDLAHLYNLDSNIYASLASIPQFSEQISDHLPVVASFGARFSTGTEPHPKKNEVLPGSFSVSAFPNPTSGPVFIKVETDRGMEFNLRVFDVLGRQLTFSNHVLSSGMNIIQLTNMSTWPIGLYFYQLLSPGGQIESGSINLLR